MASLVLPVHKFVISLFCCSFKYFPNVGEGICNELTSQG